MITFIQLKPKLINILMNALQMESDPQNTHMLLGGLLLSVQDSVTFEDQENSPDMNAASSGPNLMSSGKIFGIHCVNLLFIYQFVTLQFYQFVRNLKKFELYF